MLTDKYPGCKYYYTVALLRAIEDGYEEAYANGIDLYVKGYLVAFIANPYNIAELRADYSRSCLFIGKRPGTRMSHDEIIRAKDFLNGVQSG